MNRRELLKAAAGVLTPASVLAGTPVVSSLIGTGVSGLTDRQ